MECEFMLTFKSKTSANDKRKTGIVIENQKIEARINQISIKLANLHEIPNSDDFYLIAFPGIRGYQRLTVKGIPDENNLLTFNIKKTSNLVLDDIQPGSRVKVKGPFKGSTIQAG